MLSAHSLNLIHHPSTLSKESQPGQSKTEKGWAKTATWTPTFHRTGSGFGSVDHGFGRWLRSKRMAGDSVNPSINHGGSPKVPFQLRLNQNPGATVALSTRGAPALVKGANDLPGWAEVSRMRWEVEAQ